MIRLYLTGIFLALFCSALAISQAHAVSLPDVVALDDVTSVGEAADDIRATLESQGFEIALTLDLGAIATSIGQSLEPTQLIMARLPSFAEKRMIRKGITVGLDLPMKFLVYEEDGQILLATNSVGHLLDKHDLHTYDYLLSHADHANQQFGEADQGIVTIQSNRSKEATLQALQTALLTPGTIVINAIIDFADRGHSRYYSAPLPTLIIWGNANIGVPILQSDRTAALDLPPKFLVWEDRSGNVFISYDNPRVWAERHDLDDQAMRIMGIAGALANFAAIGAGL